MMIHGVLDHDRHRAAIVAAAAVAKAVAAITTTPLMLVVMVYVRPSLRRRMRRDMSSGPCFLWIYNTLYLHEIVTPFILT